MKNGDLWETGTLTVDLDRAVDNQIGPNSVLKNRFTPRAKQLYKGKRMGQSYGAHRTKAKEGRLMAEVLKRGLKEKHI